MDKPVRTDFTEIPEHLICECEENCIFEDQSSIGLGYVCALCAKYCDVAVIAWKSRQEQNKIVKTVAV